MSPSKGPRTKLGYDKTVSSILNKVEVEKDEDPEAEALPRILNVGEGPD